MRIPVLQPAWWMADGACVTEGDLDAMFPVRADDQRAAAQLCKSCPVVRECLAHALDNDEQYGVWGGRTERERRALLKRHPGIRSWARVFLGRASTDA